MPADEPLVFKVKPDSDAHRVGSALAHSISEGKVVSLRAVGASAVNQAQKSVTIANGWVATRGILLATIPAWTDVEGRDGGTISAMTFKVIQVH